MKSTFQVNAISAAIFFALTQQTAFAQDAQDSSSENAGTTDVEKIQVTGSRIKRYEFSLPTPVFALGKSEIEDVGAADLTDALLEIPSVVAGVTEVTSGSGIQRNGIQSIDLRNLGDNRTLTLIDGRRTVANTANSNRVSQSDLPAGFINRVEVVTGAKSSVYGSDAVAGVVNLITESEQEGFELDVTYRKSNDLARDSKTYELSWGSNFDDNKGYIFAALDYDDRSVSNARDIPRTQLQARWDYETRIGRDNFGLNVFQDKFGDDIPAGDILPSEYGDLGNNIAGGRFDGNDFWYNAEGIQTDFEEERDGHDSRFFRSYRSPRERFNFAIKGEYELNEDTQAFITLIRSNTDTANFREPRGRDYNDRSVLVDPVTFIGTSITPGRIPLDNPFAPPEIVASESSSSGIDWDRNFAEVGIRRIINERTTTRGWAGLRGIVFDDWDWEASIGYGKFQQEQVRTNEISIVNLRNALNAERLADGTIQCADAQDRQNGCVPINLFGLGSITEDAAAYIRQNIGLQAELEQVNFQAFMSGELFEMPAGAVAASVGVEYRKDSVDLLPDQLSQVSGNTSVPVPAFDASIAVSEAFGELFFPLIEDAPGIKSLSAETSVRVAHYDIEKVGTVVSFGVGVQYQPIDSLNIRVNFGRALRAPDLAELFSPPRGDIDSFDDICDGVDLTSTGAVAENCSAESGILAFINDPDNDGEFEQETSRISSPNAGNADLKEEESDTFTLGFVVQPESMKGFSFSADFYDIEIKDAIDSLSNEEILRRCYEDDVSFDSNLFCEVISRNPNDGQLENLVQRQFNLDAIETSGVDYNIAYEFDLDNVGLLGKLDVRYNHTHVIKLRTISENEVELNQLAAIAAGEPASENEASDGTLDGFSIDNDKGEQVSESFEDRGRLSVSWQHENWRVNWRTSFFGKSIDSHDLREDYEGVLAAYEEAIAAGEQITKPEEPMFLNFDSELFHNLSVRYTTKIKENRVRVYAGVNNLFNNNGPFTPAGVSSGNTGNFADGYGLRGRSAYVRMNLRF